MSKAGHIGPGVEWPEFPGDWVHALLDLHVREHEAPVRIDPHTEWFFIGASVEIISRSWPPEVDVRGLSVELFSETYANLEARQDLLFVAPLSFFRRGGRWGDYVKFHVPIHAPGGTVLVSKLRQRAFFAERHPNDLYFVLQGLKRTIKKG